MSKQTEGEKKSAKCKNIHCSAISKAALWDLKSRVDILKLHDFFHNPKSKCQKNHIYPQTIPNGTGWF